MFHCLMVWVIVTIIWKHWIEIIVSIVFAVFMIYTEELSVIRYVQTFMSVVIEI
jgi:hypothetical protein